MAQLLHHAVTVCTDCRVTGSACRPGLVLLARLGESLDRLGIGPEVDFSIQGTACMAGCRRPCTIAFQASGKATYLFGDIEPDADIDALVDFARLYAQRVDGMTREGERPRALAGKVLARVPAAILVSQPVEGALQ